MAHSCDCPCCFLVGPGPDNYGRDTPEKIRARAKKFATELLKDPAMKEARKVIEQTWAKARRRRCDPGCGKRCPNFGKESCWHTEENPNRWCTKKCRDAGRSLNPPRARHGERWVGRCPKCLRMHDLKYACPPKRRQLRHG